MKFLLSVFIVFVSVEYLAAQEDQSVTKGFIIINASKDYNIAKGVVEDANKQLGYEIDLRGLEYNAAVGLSFSKENCEKNGFEFPAYIQRGREKDGKFISIEYTSGYNNFTAGYYIVVVASYQKGKQEIQTALSEVKKHYEDAYVKYTDIYMGCLH
ncbi:MAG: hypothetical protein C0594_17740 [Marinilabiliales bacterium]|nr:MAG: hypothetical protein C0594_17740 [Marinilabiliales bacterium]